MADVYSFVAIFDACAKGNASGRRRTTPLRHFRASEPFTDDCRHRLCPLPQLATGNRTLWLIVDRFSKLTRGVPTPKEDAETVPSASCDMWLSSYGPLDTLSTDNGRQLTFACFRGICGNQTIVAQLTAHVSEGQESGDELVSVLSLA